MKTKKLYRFSLIELLIVVAIISILAALLLPALNKAREKAQRAFCIGNIKQIATAQLSYANDYEDDLVFHAVTGQNETPVRNRHERRFRLHEHPRELRISLLCVLSA